MKSKVNIYAILKVLLFITILVIPFLDIFRQLFRKEEFLLPLIVFYIIEFFLLFIPITGWATIFGVRSLTSFYLTYSPNSMEQNYEIQSVYEKRK